MDTPHATPVPAVLRVERDEHGHLTIYADGVPLPLPVAHQAPSPLTVELEHNCLPVVRVALTGFALEIADTLAAAAAPPRLSVVSDAA